MNYFLFDNPSDKNRLSFISKLSSLEMKYIGSPKCNKQIVGWLQGCINVLRLSKHGDTIACWYDFQAILCYWLSVLTFRRRKIVCINLLLKDKDSLKNRVVSWLYRRALNSKNVVASVTSLEYGEHLKKRVDVKKNFFLVHDVFHDSYKYEKHIAVMPNTVFCGGRNGRDWRFMIEVAKAMPKVEFHLVMPEATYQDFAGALPNNVVAKCNLSIDEFMEEMCSCEIVALPLDTEAPAGLIVLFQAAANTKYIITTDTRTTREYLSDGRGCLLPNDIGSWTKAIKEKLGNGQKNALATQNMLHFLKSECSEKKFVDGIELMINGLK